MQQQNHLDSESVHAREAKLALAELEINTDE